MLNRSLTRVTLVDGPLRYRFPMFGTVPAGYHVCVSGTFPLGTLLRLGSPSPAHVSQDEYARLLEGFASGVNHDVCSPNSADHK